MTRRPARRGLFITFEGIEGSGKSLQIARLARRLRAGGVPHLVTREPGGTKAGDAMRRIFLGAEGRGLDPWTELFLVEAARAQHLTEVIRPALARGRTVLCDRFIDSTLAYQGFGRGIPRDVIRSLHRLSGLRPSPDLTVLLDLPVRRGLSRAAARNASDPRRRREARIDAESERFHERVRRGFLAVAVREPRRVVRVPADGPPAEVERVVHGVVGRLLGLPAESGRGLPAPRAPRRRRLGASR